jgi:hypothetical protein
MRIPKIIPGVIPACTSLVHELSGDDGLFQGFAQALGSSD